jgi:hypothetical protein
VMVGDQHGDAQFVGARHSLDAGDAVVNGDDEIGRALGRQFDDFRRQAVAVFEAVRDEVTPVSYKHLP